MNENTKHPLLQAVVAHLEQHELSFIQATWGGVPVIHMTVTSEMHIYNITIAVRVDRGDTVQVWVRSPLNVPEASRSAVAEFLHRANNGLILGGFEFDMDNGHVSYKNSHCSAGQPFHPDMMAPLLKSSLSTIDRYMPGLLAVVFQQVSPAEAIDAIEDGAMTRKLNEMLDEDAA